MQLAVQLPLVNLVWIMAVYIYPALPLSIMLHCMI